MTTPVIGMTGTPDQATLDALREGVAGVLAEQSGSTAVHAFIDGKNALDRELWAQAGALGWLGFGIPEQYGGLGMGARGLAILHTELGRQAAPGPVHIHPLGRAGDRRKRRRNDPESVAAAARVR